MGYSFFSPERATSFGSSRGSGYSFFKPPTHRGLTLNQAVAKAMLENKSQERSLLGSVLHGGKSSLSFVLRQISRPSWAVAEGSRRALEGEGFDVSDFFKGASRGFQAKTHTTFSDVLEQEGVLKGHGRLRAVAGFGLDVVTDPTLPLLIAGTIVSGGLGAPLLAGKLSLNAARAAAEKGLVREAGMHVNAAEQAFRAAGDIGTAHRQWARLERAKLNRPLGDWGDMDEIRLSVAQKHADVELAENTRKVMQLQYKIPFTHGKGIPLTPARLAPRVPSLKRTANAGGILGKIPGVPAVAGVTGRTFKHGFDEEAFAKPQLVAEHGSEKLMDNYMREALTRFGQFSHLTEEERLQALGEAERAGSDLIRGRSRQLDEPTLSRMNLSDDQKEFIRNWHGYFETLRNNDKAAGIAYDKELEKIYVPNVYKKDGGVVQDSLKAQAGYAKERAGNHAIDELKRLKDSGAADKHGIETDIMKLAAIRTARGARKQGRQILKEHMYQVHGIPVQLPDFERMKKWADLADETQAKMLGLKSHNPMWIKGKKGGAATRISREYTKRIEASVAKRDKRLADIDAKVMEHTAKVANKAMGLVKKTPTLPQLKRMTGPTFAKAVTHLSEEDRKLAYKIKSTQDDVKRITAEVEKLSSRGAHGKNYRKLANDIITAGKRLGMWPSVGKKAEARVMNKGDIGYTAQPQGKRRVADKATPEKKPDFSHVLAPSKRGETWKENVRVALESVEAQVKRDWDDVRSRNVTPRGPASEAILKQQDRARLTAQKQHNERVQNALKWAQHEQGKVEEEIHEKFVKEAPRMERLQARMDRIADRLSVDPPMMRNPEAAGLKEWNIAGETVAFPPAIDKAMGRVDRILTDDELMGSLALKMQKAMAYWKLSVTSVNPGYRIRNTMSDLWNMYIAGVPSGRMVQYGAKAAALQVRAEKVAGKLADAHARGIDPTTVLNKGDWYAVNRITESYNHGVLSGLFQGDVDTVAAMYRAGSATKAFVKTAPPLVLIRWAQTFNRHGENWGRLTHYLYRRDYERLGANDAADWVKKAHFDYEELTPIERNKFKLFLPFYTWTRKNIPYQITQIASRPGKVATFPKGLAMANELATGDSETEGPQEGIMPDWMRDKFALRVPGGAASYLLPQLGIADLSKIDNPREFSQLLGPQIKVPLELLTGKSMLTGEDIDKGRRTPVSGFAAGLLGGVPGADVGPTARTVRGERVEDTGASPWVGYAASQIPWANQIVNRESKIRQQQQGNPWLSRMSQYLGISVYDRDLETEQMVAQLEFKDEVAAMMKRLRDEGVIPPAQQRKQSPYQQQIASMLAGGG